LNNYAIRRMNANFEILKEVLCPARRDSTLQALFTMSSSGGLKNEGSWMMTRIGKILSSA
jgi:hypothetical protein